jgi:hypothetical protein
MERRNFFRALTGACAAIAALWSAPKPEAAGLREIAAANLERMSAKSPFVWIRPPDRLLVCTSECWFGDWSRIYESGFVDLDKHGTWYVYADDPNYRGGEVKYQATMDPREVFLKNGRLFFGSIIRPV